MDDHTGIISREAESETKMSQGYLVEDLKSGKIIGYKLDAEPGGIVSAMDGKNVVGILVTGVAQGEWILKADKPWHTGKKYDGNSVLWAHHPSEVGN